MTSPVIYKTIKVSPESHKAIHDLAARLGGSADDAIAHLVGTSTIRVPLSDIQRQRWNAAAHATGVGVADFVKMRVEAAIQYTGDPAALHVIYTHVRALTDAAGLSAPSSTSGTPSSTPGTPSSTPGTPT